MTIERSRSARPPDGPQDGAEIAPVDPAVPDPALPGPVGTVRPAVPGNLRATIAALAAVSAVVVGVLAITHHRASEPDVVDVQVIAAVRAVWPEAGIGAYIVDGLAEPAPAVLIVAALIIGCLLARRWRLAAVAAIGPLSAIGTTTALKPLVERTIHGSSLAFPSGHTAFATAAALVLGLLVIGVFRPGRAVGGAVLAVLVLVAGAVMAVDQIVLDAHYPTDTVGGFFTAITVVSVVALLADVLADLPTRRDRGQEPRNSR